MREVGGEREKVEEEREKEKTKSILVNNYMLITDGVRAHTLS